MNSFPPDFVFSVSGVFLCRWRFVFYLLSFTAGLGSLINVSPAAPTHTHSFDCVTLANVPHVMILVKVVHSPEVGVVTDVHYSNEQHS